jgi:hypothetical protein
MQKESKTNRLNKKTSCITTTSTYAAYRTHIFMIGSHLKSEDTSSSDMIDKGERKEE